MTILPKPTSVWPMIAKMNLRQRQMMTWPLAYALGCEFESLDRDVGGVAMVGALIDTLARQGWERVMPHPEWEGYPCDLPCARCGHTKLAHEFNMRECYWPECGCLGFLEVHERVIPPTPTRIKGGQARARSRSRYRSEQTG